MALDTDQCRALANAPMTLSVPWKQVNFLANRVTNGSWTRSLLHVVVKISVTVNMHTLLSVWPQSFLYRLRCIQTGLIWWCVNTQAHCKQLRRRDTNHANLWNGILHLLSVQYKTYTATARIPSHRPCKQQDGLHEIGTSYFPRSMHSDYRRPHF